VDRKATLELAESIRERYEHMDQWSVSGLFHTGFDLGTLDQQLSGLNIRLSLPLRWLDSPEIAIAKLNTIIDRIQNPPPPTGSDADQNRYSTDFRSVVWCGVNHSFTAAQSKVVELLWKNFYNQTPESLSKKQGIK
jgi:hypothetical protein